jgi:hypothetical protein
MKTLIECAIEAGAIESRYVGEDDVSMTPKQLQACFDEFTKQNSEPVYQIFCKR